jgi:hypothetical protein
MDDAHAERSCGTTAPATISKSFQHKQFKGSLNPRFLSVDWLEVIVSWYLELLIDLGVYTCSLERKLNDENASDSRSRVAGIIALEVQRITSGSSSVEQHLKESSTDLSNISMELARVGVAAVAISHIPSLSLSSKRVLTKDKQATPAKAHQTP